MDKPLEPARWAVSAVVVFLGTLALQSSGLLTRWNNLLIEKYSGWTQREVTSNIVVVGIDAQSLSQLHSWPWPRSYHAKLLDFLHDASAARVFIDIDFSSPSRSEEDQALSAALARWAPGRVVLPLFLQSTSGTEASIVLTRPLPQFEQHASLASVNLVPDNDSIVRVAETSWDIEGSRVPSVFSTLSGAAPRTGSMPIDFSISPGSFAYFSYSDILRGSVPLEELRGKTVLIGATALELGDMQPVPVYRTLPGVVIHALATQTAVISPVRPVTAIPQLLLLASWTLLFAWLFRRRSWTLTLPLTGIALPAAAGIGLLAYLLRLRLDTMTLACAVAGNFVSATLASLDAADLRNRILYRVANKRRAVLDSVFASSYDGILWVDEAGAILSANAAVLSLLGSPEDQVVGQPVTRFLLHPLLTSTPDNLSVINGRILEAELHPPAGASVPVEISTTLAQHDEGRQFTLILRDLRERRRQEMLLRHQATHDALTGLPNRFLLVEELERRLANPALQPMSILYINLARFKQVNDTLGHEAGDTVLRTAAFRLEGVLAGRGMICRLDGDGFAVFAECGGDRNWLLQLIRDLGESIRRPFDFQGIPIGIGANIGIACFPKHGREAVTLLKNAGVAMYEARRTGEEMAFYEAVSDENGVRQLALLGELREALERNALELHFQPKVSLRTGMCDSVEALLRWNHPVHGFISPGELIPLIEPTEMLRPLTDWTIDRALAQQSHWADQGHRIRIAVNLSARLLQDQGIPERISGMITAHRAMPDALELEITESAMLLDAGRARLVGRKIRELGVPLSVDDYGTGHSSLAYLRDLSVSTLKLDRTFVQGLENSDGDRSIVESTLALAHALGLTVVAEGVETSWQANYLRDLGYDYGQGYFFARAMEADSCLRWIIDRNTTDQRQQAKVA